MAAWGIGGDEDMDPGVGDLNENRIVAVLMAVLAVAFIAFVTAVPYIDKDGSFRNALSSIGGFGGKIAAAGRGIGGGQGFEINPVRPDGLGPISIGMTADEVRKLGPANFYRGAGGRLVANVRESNAAYTAWFTTGKQSGMVHRLRYDRLMPGKTADDAVEFMKKGLGEPVHENCSGGQGSNRVRECALRWTAVNGVQMNAQIRQRTDDLGVVQTTVSVNAAASGSAEALNRGN